jgi:hypothetical protein
MLWQRQVWIAISAEIFGRSWPDEFVGVLRYAQEDTKNKYDGKKQIPSLRCGMTTRSGFPSGMTNL